MDFVLLDRIVALDSGRFIQATKNLSLAEGYLRDHFPGYPVMPGVMMLEALVEAACWLTRLQTNFAYSLVHLAEVRNIKYGHFVTPGNTLEVMVRAVNWGSGEADFSGQGMVEGQAAVSGRFRLRYYNLADRDPRYRRIDQLVIESAKQRFQALGGQVLTAKGRASGS
jgi:3-hydroxyacyl-[acyl-carrier-protein] dehydratase